MSKLLCWTVHTLEIFMWPEDYDLSPADPFFDGPYLDLLPEYWSDGLIDEDVNEGSSDSISSVEIRWRVQIEYADETEQDIVSYQDYLFDRPAELLFALSEYFEPESGDFDEI